MKREPESLERRLNEFGRGAQEMRDATPQALDRPSPPAGSGPKASAAQEEIRATLRELRAHNDELIATRAALDGERQRYRELFDFAPCGYVTTDPDGVIREANAVAERMLGVPKEFLGDKALSSYLPPAQALAARAQRAGTPQSMDTVLRCRLGAPLPVAVSVAARRDDVGRVSELRWILQDISERRVAETALAESERRFAVFMRHIPGFAWLKDRDGRYLFVNEGTANYYGLAPGDFIGKTDDELFPRAIAAFYRESDRRVMETGRALQILKSVPQGNEIHEFLVTEFPVPDGAMGCAGTGGIALNVTEHRRTEKALDESRRRLQALFDQALDGILLADNDARYVGANPAACELLGRSLDEVTHMSMLDLVPDADRELARRHWHSFLEAGESKGEFTILQRDGTTIDVEYRAVANITAGLHLSVFRDITERKRAETALRVAKERLEAIVMGSPVAIGAIDPQGVITLWNPAAERLFGWKSEQVLGRPNPLVAANDRERFMRRLRGELDGTVKPGPEEVRLHKDGSPIQVGLWTTILRDEAGKAMGLLRMFVDIAERKRAEAEREDLVRQLTEQRQELQALSFRLFAAQETERRHIARELHDEVGQVLTGLKLNIEAALRLPREESEKQLESGLAVVRELMALVRSMSLDLGPPGLEDEAGLGHALRWYLPKYASRTAINVVFEQDGAERPCSHAVKVAAYRIVQEALTNVARHAGASEATVRMTMGEDALEIRIEDQGAGFDVQSALAAGSSIGLASMRERARLLGGEWAVRSSPGAGTRITARFPLAADGERGSWPK
jgi:PAS domain S-box-containing protein